MSSPPHLVATERTPELTLNEQARVIAGLRSTLRQACAPQAVACHETHISWVLVTPTEAFKLKKAVAPGFLDFSTCERRQHCCAEEVRLNRRLAPAVYLGVLPVTGTIDAPVLGGIGPVIDHVVHMRAFAQEGLWDHLAMAGALEPAMIDELASTLQTFHSAAAVAPADTRFGSPDHVRAPMLDTLAALDSLVSDGSDRARLADLRRWEARRFSELEPVFERRRREGRVRECHGDLHLRNIAQVDGKVTPFDCIEFSEDLRWIDTTSEVAFLAMDLHAHGLPLLAHRFIDGWLQRSGDFDGLQVLGYYTAYRALVRAKVAVLRAAQTGGGPDAGGTVHDSIVQAHAETRGRPRALVITHGLAGSGKTTLTQALLEDTGAIRVRADVERKRQAGLGSLDRSRSALGGGVYTAAATDAVYARLNEVAAVALASGWPVVLDATYLRQAQRDRARRLAVAARVPFQILDVEADLATLRARVAQRLSDARDASEADAAVLEAQRATREPLTPEERAVALTINTCADSGRADWTALRQRWMLDPAD